MEYGMLIEDLRNVQAWLGHGDIKKAHEYLESIIVSLEAAEQIAHPTPRQNSQSCKMRKLMNVTLVYYNDLPEEEKYQQPDNGAGKEEASYLKVEISGKAPIYYSDAMEPEDAKFYRDLSWIKSALLAAYQAGKEAG